VELNNGLIACAPGHPLMARIVAALPGRKRAPRVPVRVGSSGRDNSDRCCAMDTISRTGPGHFSRCVLCCVVDGRPPLNTDDVLLLPPSFFYPLPNDCRKLPPGECRAFVRPESVAMHHWFSSWQDENNDDAH